MFGQFEEALGTGDLLVRFRKSDNMSRAVVATLP
jgi:hypothetical protein